MFSSGSVFVASTVCGGKSSSSPNRVITPEGFSSLAIPRAARTREKPPGQLVGLANQIEPGIGGSDAVVAQVARLRRRRPRGPRSRDRGAVAL